MLNRREVSLVVVTALVVALIVYVAISGFPPENEKLVGAIGGVQKAERYQSEQMVNEDIILSKTEVQKFLQSDKVQKLLKNEQFVAAVSNPEVAKIFSNPEVAKIFASPEVAKIFSNPEVAKIFASPEVAKKVSKKPHAWQSVVPSGESWRCKSSTRYFA